MSPWAGLLLGAVALLIMMALAVWLVRGWQMNRDPVVRMAVDHRRRKKDESSDGV